MHWQLSSKRYSESVALICPFLNPQTFLLGPRTLCFHSRECGRTEWRNLCSWWRKTKRCFLLMVEVWQRNRKKTPPFSWKADHYHRKYHSVEIRIIAKQDVSLEAYKQSQKTILNSLVWDFGVQFLFHLTKCAVISLEWDFIELY